MWTEYSHSACRLPCSPTHFVIKVWPITWTAFGPSTGSTWHSNCQLFRNAQVFSIKCHVIQQISTQSPKFGKPRDGFVLSPSLFFPWIQFVLSVLLVLQVRLLLDRSWLATVCDVSSGTHHMINPSRPPCPAFVACNTKSREKAWTDLSRDACRC